jgi:hypothetical protein
LVYERIMDDYELGRVGYEAYGDKAGWKNYEGKPMPKWDEVPQHIRDKWAAAAKAIGEAIHQSVVGAALGYGL